ncbi:MAG: oxidoreductase [Deltaproteobacteria bacterium]|nr:oxidoreductase [Deltaproteobacteria bacterium]
MSDKLKVAMYWAAGCGGCDIALLELHEQLINFIEHVDIVFWPCVIDIKYKDVEAMHDGSIDACFINGAMRNEENIQVAQMLRRKSKVLIAYGACSCFGGIVGLANFSNCESLLTRVYDTTESTINPEKIRPQLRTKLADGTIELPQLTDYVGALGDFASVDYYMPGCPPVTEQTSYVCNLLAQNQLPPPPAIIGAGDKAVCFECPLEKHDTKVEKFYRIIDKIPDGKTCLLEQGIICMGPATRSGCGAQCLQVNMPCRGCYGAAGNTTDQGAKMVSLLGSILKSEDPETIKNCIQDITDAAGTFYRFSLPASWLRHANEKMTKE